MATDRAMEAAFRYATEAPRDEDLDLLDCNRLADLLDHFAADAVREEREDIDEFLFHEEHDEENDMATLGRIRVRLRIRARSDGEEGR